MKEYQEYTITINFTSSLESKLQSDTIFGHICWAIRYLKEKNTLPDFLELYSNDSAPPLLVSNGFPKGYLPKPSIPPVTQEEIQTVVKNNNDDRITASHKITTIKKLDLIPFEILKQFRHKPITPSALFSAIYIEDIYNSIMRAEEGRKTITVQHNTIDRVKGKVKEGGLYFLEETFFDPTSIAFQIYLKTNFFSKEELLKIFKYISVEGFGRDGSTGKGSFDFDESIISEGINLPEAENPNAFMTLSSYIPTTNNPIKGFYNIMHKYGKLGGLYAKGVAEVYGNPFKVPLIMFSAGSTFFDKDFKKGKVYGGLVNGVHENKDIRQYAFAFPLGINLEEKDEDL